MLVIDVQEEWRTPDSPLYLGDFKELVAKVKELVEVSRKKGIPVIWVRHVLNADGSDRERFQPKDMNFMVEGTKGAQIMSELKPLPSETILRKNKLSCFLDTNLDELLKKMKVDELILSGIMTNGCVRTTAIDASSRNFKVTLVKDCCSTDSKETDEFTFKDLKNLLFGLECISLDEFRR